MTTPPMYGLARVAGRPFASFSQAVDAVFEVLEEHLPPSRLILGRLDHEQSTYQAMEVGGGALPAIEAGLSMQLPESFCVHMVEDQAPRVCADAAADAVYSALPMRAEFGIRSYLGVPLELSDGTRVGGIEAVSEEAGVYDTNHLALVTISSRLLSYEWERISRESLLRRLEAQQRDGATTDPLTGVANRTKFLEHLDREWELANRGSVESYLVVCRLPESESTDQELATPLRDLALKDAADALGVTARRTDVVGRLGVRSFGVVLVGCKGDQGVKAFCERFRGALERSTHARPSKIEPALAARALNTAKAAADLMDWSESGPFPDAPRTTEMAAEG